MKTSHPGKAHAKVACYQVAIHFSTAIWLLLFACTAAIGQDVGGGCGNLARSWGPFDYRADRYVPESTYRSHAALLRIVEVNHFTPEVEMLIRGKTAARPGGDLEYTLNIFPNHHRALIAMAALGEKERSTQPSGSGFTVDCWFRRAVTWRPDDQVVRMIYAQFLAKNAREREADEHLIIAAAMNGGANAFTHYNVGLIYFDMKNFEKALLHAHKAYELGFGGTALKDQLKGAGKWTEPSATSPSEGARTP